MPVTVACEECGKRFTIPDDLFEKRVQGRVAGIACRKCGNTIRVDGTIPPPAVAADAAPVAVSVPGPAPVPIEASHPAPVVARSAAPAVAAAAVATDGVIESSPLSTRAPLTKIGRYALFEQFAVGGMATVHFGRLDGAGGFSRVVAIKRLLPQLVRNEDFTQMLIKEARLAARVRHPNVVPTLDVVASKGDVLLVLEYVHGEALSTLCRTQAKRKKEHIPIDIALAVVRDVLQGLAAIHEATDERGRSLGLIHRDISPPNVLVGADGLSRVLDFGIAKALEHIEESDPNRIKGKTGYLSPEQIRGERLTQRSDVFSAGIILWEMLATRRLFSADMEIDRLATILKGNYPRPSASRPDVPPALDDAVMRALALDADARFASPRELLAALDETARPAPPQRVAEWVTELASEALAVRSRRLAQVETWIDSAGEIPLSSGPFAAEVAITRTPPPPTPSEATPPIELRRRSGAPSSPPKAENDPEAPASPEPRGSRVAALAISLLAAAVIAYLATR